MRLLKSTAFFLLLCACVSAAASNIGATRHAKARSAQQHRDRVISTRTVKGSLKGFEVGDYMHAVIKLQSGKEDSYFIGSPGLDYFLALHKGEPLTLTYQVVDSYIEQAGGVQRINRLSGARAGKLTHAAWWKNMRAKHSFAQLDKMYGSLTEKYRLNP
ncbi:MAG: hypothetical protein QOF02_1582 [Blastocatellia bacterium]|jgi:hypothetical protein|nr:hypothetical protein [Blastocatellia bacterium]